MPVVSAQIWKSWSKSVVIRCSGQTLLADNARVDGSTSGQDAMIGCQPSQSRGCIEKVDSKRYCLYIICRSSCGFLPQCLLCGEWNRAGRRKEPSLSRHKARDIRRVSASRSAQLTGTALKGLHGSTMTGVEPITPCTFKLSGVVKPDALQGCG